MDRTLRDQVQGTAIGRVIAEVHLQIVIARQALELAAPEAVHGSSVERADDVRDVLAIVVHCPRDVVRCRNRGDGKLRGRNHEALIYKDLGPNRVVNCREGEVIVVVDLPQFRGNADVVEAVVRHELIPSDFVPFSRRGYVGRTESIDS